MIDPRLADVLAFWFGPASARRDGAWREERMRFWFSGGEAVDAEIRTRFSFIVEETLSGRIEAPREDPRGWAALIILLDQFPRNLYRGTARAYAGDRRALALAEDAVKLGIDRALSAPERLFLYVPFQHAEDLGAQERGIEHLRRLVGEPGLDAEDRRLIEASIPFAEAHREVIARFGRFPHRNAPLGRASTSDEELWLTSPDRPGWAR